MRFKLFILAIVVSITAVAQFKQDTSRNVNFLAIPVLFRTPETGWAYGASGSIAFKTSFKNDTLTRTSVIQATGIWTERGQNIQGLDATIYFPKENYILYFQSSHTYFPENFWGIGTKTKDTWSERYVYEQFQIFPHFKKRVFNRLFVGILYDYQNVFKIKYNVGGVFDTTVFLGKTPYQISGGGISLSYDTRNKAFWPTKGIFIQSYFNAYNKTIGSDYDFTKWIVDIRFFQKLVLNHILAMQFYNYSTFGESPLRNLAAIGGQDNLRGFYRGRFRDNNAATFIAEYRAPIVWKLSLCAFGGIGNVYSTKYPFAKNDLLYSFGGGIRLTILERDKLNLRVDYGYYSKYNSGLYVTIGESF